MNCELLDAIKCVRIIDGTNSCCAAYVPRSMVKNLTMENELDSFVQVLELYNDDSEFLHNRLKSHFQQGKGSLHFHCGNSKGHVNLPFVL
jgi:hypothetical protein